MHLFFLKKIVDILSAICTYVADAKYRPGVLRPSSNVELVMCQTQCKWTKAIAWDHFHWVRHENVNIAYSMTVENVTAWKCCTEPSWKEYVIALTRTCFVEWVKHAWTHQSSSRTIQLWLTGHYMKFSCHDLATLGKTQCAWLVSLTQ